MKEHPQKLLIIGPQFFFHYCQPAQKQPKFHFLFHKKSSCRTSISWLCHRVQDHLVGPKPQSKQTSYHKEAAILQAVNCECSLKKNPNSMCGCARRPGVGGVRRIQYYSLSSLFIERLFNLCRARSRKKRSSYSLLHLRGALLTAAAAALWASWAKNVQKPPS